MGLRKFIKVDRNLSGQKNNLLTASYKIEKNGRWYWVCSCDCGGTTSIREDYFVTGKTKSCGCYGSQNSIYKINQKPPGVSALNSVFRSYQASAKRRGISFEITKEEFSAIVMQNCHYCDSPPSDTCFNKTANGILKINGIDRKSSFGPYALNNILPACKSCNFMKGTLEYNDFIARCGVVYLTRKIK